MYHKFKAFLIIIAFHLSLKRSVNRPFRHKVAHQLLHGLDLKNCEKIILNTQYLKIDLNSILTQRAHTLFPLSDAEREYMKAVLIWILPRSFEVEKVYEEDVELTHQLSYWFTKS